MSVFYVDTSAAVKLVAEEPHSAAFAAFYDANADAAWASSALLGIELMRAVRREMPKAAVAARELLTAFERIRIDDDIVAAAMDEPDRHLRSLDAIHIASAQTLQEDLTALVTYDDRMALAATAAGIPVLAPR